MLTRLLHRVRALRSARRRLVAAGLVLAALATALAIVGFLLARAAPRWWRARGTDEAVVAQAVENGLFNHMTAVRPRGKDAADHWVSEPWSVSIDAADANAWIAERLPGWLANRKVPVAWPREVREVQVEFAPGVIRVGTRIGTHRDQYVTLDLRPEIAADGSLWLRAEGVGIGDLPVPAGLAMGWVRDSGREMFGEAGAAVGVVGVVDALEGGHALVNDAVVRIDGGRRVRLLAVVPREGRVEIVCRTEGKKR